jgi:hypothetical protein
LCILQVEEDLFVVEEKNILEFMYWLTILIKVYTALKKHKEISNMDI